MSGPIQENPISRSSHVDHETGTGREISDEERSGVSSTDTEAESALGVGGSPHRPAEQVADESGGEEGRRDEGTRGPAQRPSGSSTGRDSTGVDPQDP